MPVDIEKLEAVIESAMKTAVRMGWTVTTGRHVDGSFRGPQGVKCCCPLEAVAIVNGGSKTAATGKDYLGLGQRDGSSFWMGFDDFDWRQEIGAPTSPELMALGERFASRVRSGEFTRAVVCPEMP